MRSLAFAVAVQLLLQAVARSDISREIPFEYRDGLIWVKVQIAGKVGSLNFLLDSGSSVSAVDLQTAQTHGVHLGDQQSIEGVSGRALGYSVKDFRGSLGSNALPKSVVAIDLGAISGSCHQRIDGILGVDFFRNRIVRIDFHAGKISLLRNCDMDLANCEILPMKMRNGAFCVPMQIAGNPTQWMRLDTGCDSALEWVITGTEKRRIRGPSIGLAGASVTRINTSVRLGNDCFKDIAVGIHAKQIFPGENGLVGNGMLSKFCLTIDEPNRRVIFEKTR